MTLTFKHTCVALGAAFLFVLLPASAGAADEPTNLEAQLAALVAHVDRLMFDLQTKNGNPESTPLSKESLITIMDAGMMWLQRTQETDGDEVGHFRYEYKPFDDVYVNDDNIVRQAGTFYQMGEMARADTDALPDVEEQLFNSMQYFESLTKEDTYEGHSFSCITSKMGSSECKLGATSLALVGLLDLLEAYPAHKDEYEDLAAAYLNFIFATKKAEGGFRDRHFVGRSVQPPRESSFSNGEAMLALARYYKHDPQPEIKTLLEELFLYIDSDAVLFDSPLYLWAMAALRDMHDIWPNDAYISYAESYTAWRVSGFQNRKLTQYNMCAYVEGLTSAYALLADVDTETDQGALLAEIDFWLNRSADLQVGENERYRVVTNESGDVALERVIDLNRAAGGFLTSYETHTERIDYTQHCLNAYLLRYLEMEKEGGA